MRVLDLFSGIGGFSLAASWLNWETVAFCEKDNFCQKVLNKNFPGVPIHNDIKNFPVEEYKDGTINIICGGAPCQGFSVAGKRRGKADDRYLWPEMFNIIKAIKPNWVVFENVTGIIKMALDDVLSDLESEEYTCQTFIIPACGVEAQHKRDRIWVVANSRHSTTDTSGSGKGLQTLSHTNNSGDRASQCRINGNREKIEQGQKEFSQFKPNGHSSIMGNPKHNGSSSTEIEGITGEDANRSEKREKTSIEFKRTGASQLHASNPKSIGVQGQWRSRDKESYTNGEQELSVCSSENRGKSFRRTKSEFCRGVDALSKRLDLGGINPLVERKSVKDRAKRIKALGNAIVPTVVYEIFRVIDYLEKSDYENKTMGSM